MCVCVISTGVFCRPARSGSIHQRIFDAARNSGAATADFQRASDCQQEVFPGISPVDIPRLGSGSWIKLTNEWIEGNVPSRTKCVDSSRFLAESSYHGQVDVRC